MIDILKAAVLGVIEGITEWLPISSTGHLILADEFIRLGTSEAFKEMFDVVIQLGAIMAVVVLFWNKLWPFTMDKKQNYIKRDTWSMWFKVIVAVLPAMIIGLPLDDWMTEHLHNPFVIALTLILYGILFLWMETCFTRDIRVKSIETLDYRIALGIGLFQVLSLVPGTSRSGATILGAMLLGTTRTVAAEFTFFLAIPVMFGASLIKVLKFGFAFTGMELAVLATGMITAFAVSILCIRFLMNYIKKHDFKIFGVYRILLGVIVIVYFGLSAVFG